MAELALLGLSPETLSKIVAKVVIAANIGEETKEKTDTEIVEELVTKGKYVSPAAAPVCRLLPLKPPTPPHDASRNLRPTNLPPVK